MDIFEKYIKENKDKDCRALTCKSYGEVYKKEYHKELELKETNFELATYGDALLKFLLCSILLDKCEQLSEEKKKYESDEFLIEKVAKHYDLLQYVRFDKGNKGIQQEYKYSKKDKTKYIATTVEAVLGALFKEEKYDFNSIFDLVESWMKL